jgi:hypothetical protein
MRMRFTASTVRAHVLHSRSSSRSTSCHVAGMLSLLKWPDDVSDERNTDSASMSSTRSLSSGGSAAGTQLGMVPVLPGLEHSTVANGPAI